MVILLKKGACFLPEKQSPLLFHPVKISSFGKRIFDLFGFANEKAKVKGPIFPTNITRTITNFPAIVNVDVNPIDNPDVPKADTTSNTIARNLASFSVMSKIKMATKLQTD